MRKCLEQNRDIKNYVVLYIKPDKPDPNVSVNYYEMRLKGCSSKKASYNIYIYLYLISLRCRS